MTIQVYNSYFGESAQILTYNGYKPICDLVDDVVDVWNGLQWRPSTVIKVNNSDTLFVIELNNGIRFSCAGKHSVAIRKNGYLDIAFIENVKVGTECVSMTGMPVVRNNFYKMPSLDDNDPPMISNINIQLAWLSQRIDKEAGCMQITSDDKQWLSEVQLMAHCIGTMPFITSSPRGYHLRWPSKDVAFLLNDLKMNINKKISDYCKVDNIVPTIASTEAYYGDFDIYTIQMI